LCPWRWPLHRPTKLVVSGYDEPIDGNVVLIANHQTFADWWYLWIWAYNQRKEGALRIILKYSLKHIPVYGWVRRCLEPSPQLEWPDLTYEASRLPDPTGDAPAHSGHANARVYLPPAQLGEGQEDGAADAGDLQGRANPSSRNARASDAPETVSVLAGMAPALAQHKSHHPFWLVIFPEGTIIREVSKAKAQAYAEKNGLKSLQHMLLPRYAGRGRICAALSPQCATLTSAKAPGR